MPIDINGDSSSKEEDIRWKRPGVYEIEDLSETFESDSFEEGFTPSYVQQKQSFSGYKFVDRFKYASLSPPLEECFEETKKLGRLPAEDNPYSFSLASLELLKKGRGFKRLTGDRIVEPRKEPICKTGQTSRMSSVEVMRFCGERFIQSFSEKLNLLALDSNPFDLSFAGLSSEEIEDIELVDTLLLSADNASSNDFERATRLLCQCDLLSSSTGNPVQRVVYYFSEALAEKLYLEAKGLVRKLTTDIGQSVSKSPYQIRYHQEVPFSQVEQFAGIQAIIENVSKSKRIHIIDLCIRCGVQWTTLMQALASRYECPVEHLKITAIGTDPKAMESTCEWLMNFATSVDILFSFKAITVSTMLDINLDHFERDPEETVAVYSMFFLWTVIPMPNQLHNLMTVISKINPSIMVVTEVEGNLNSPCFMTRFVEALFFYSAYFDCLDAHMDRHDPLRIATESHFSESAKIIVATEGKERTVRHVKIDVWRSFFAHFGMEEEDLSPSSLDQANLMIKQFPHGSRCTIDINGKSLLIGWMGTPLHSLSVWKFPNEE